MLKKRTNNVSFNLESLINVKDKIYKQIISEKNKELKESMMKLLNNTNPNIDNKFSIWKNNSNWLRKMLL